MKNIIFILGTLVSAGLNQTANANDSVAISCPVINGTFYDGNLVDITLHTKIENGEVFYKFENSYWIVVGKDVPVGNRGNVHISCSGGDSMSAVEIPLSGAESKLMLKKISETELEFSGTGLYDIPHGKLIKNKD